jgi:hypothetical protein
MFCFNCGAKLVDGAKFCSECGIKLATSSSTPMETETPVTDVKTSKKPVESVELENTMSDEELNAKSQDIIEEIFDGIFDDNKVFGNSVYIVGKNAITQEMKENLETSYIDKSKERPLLIFGYRKKLEEGFVLTTKRFVWNYNYASNGKQEVSLSDIKNIVIGKRVLARVMQIVDLDDVFYPDIYLTGIYNDSLFVVKFQKFIEKVYDLFHGDEETVEDEGKEQLELRNDDKINDILIKACHTVSIDDSLYCEIGNPIIDATSKKNFKARSNFCIPNSDNIYLIYDATVFGSCKTGFAICSSGIYYNGSKRGCWTWNEFSRLYISRNIVDIKIGDETFTDGGEGKKLTIILNTIQEYLK